MTIFRRARSILALMVLVGCGSREPADLAMSDLATCASGFWVGSDRSCTCEALPGLRTPECDHADCRTVWLLVLNEDGSQLTTDLRVSAEGGTISTAGGVVGMRGEWEVDGTHIVQHQAGGSTSFEATCDGSRLTRDGAEWRYRPDPALSASIERAIETDTWLAVPYAP